MTVRSVEITEGLLTNLSKAAPINAMEELIWNAMDSGCSRVDVSFYESNMGGIESIEVADDGDGIPPSILEQAFGKVGDSLKLTMDTTSNGRRLHGQEGRGRFKKPVFINRETLYEMVWKTPVMKLAEEFYI